MSDSACAEMVDFPVGWLVGLLASLGTLILLESLPARSISFGVEMHRREGKVPVPWEPSVAI